MKNVAVIGRGDISDIHVGAILETAGTKLAAVCDIDPSAKLRTPDGVSFYQDYLELLEREKTDVVHICLPHYLHEPVARAAVERQVHVFCEKPLAINTAEAERFAALEAQYPGIQIGLCLQNRCNKTVELLKHLIDSGDYGNVLGLRGYVPWSRPREYYESKPWRGQKKTAGGGCMMNQSVHTLDLLYFLGGQITGLKASVSQLLDYGIEVEDTVAACLDYENGAKGLFMATNANYENEGVQLSVRLEKGSFVMMDNTLYQVHEGGGKEVLIRDETMPGSRFYYGTSHRKLIQKFYQALAEGSQDYIHARDGVMSIRLIDAIMESENQHAYVKLR